MASWEFERFNMLKKQQYGIASTFPSTDAEINTSPTKTYAGMREEYAYSTLAQGEIVPAIEPGSLGTCIRQEYSRAAPIRPMRATRNIVGMSRRERARLYRVTYRALHAMRHAPCAIRHCEEEKMPDWSDASETSQ